MSAIVSSIKIYPIKSLDGVNVDSIGFTPTGSLKYDREFALVDSEGEIINAKKFASIHHIRTMFDLETNTITLSTNNKSSETFKLNEDNLKLNEWFSDFFSKDVKIIRNTVIGFPDDTLAYGPTLCSTASIREIGSWLSETNIDLVRDRFRTNIEIDGVEPFFEDQLPGEKGLNTEFKIGDVTFIANNICKRCIVPSRILKLQNPMTLSQKFLQKKGKANFMEIAMFHSLTISIVLR
jgi:uncharacterized protein